MQVVREKIQGNEKLQEIEIRKVYDKLRAEVSNNSTVSDSTALPMELNTATERVKRLLEPADAGNEDDSVCIPPSSTPSSNAPSKGIFSKADIMVICKQCAPIIACGPISEARIADALNETSAGSQILEKYTLFQLTNRVKYERRKLTLKIVKA